MLSRAQAKAVLRRLLVGLCLSGLAALAFVGRAVAAPRKQPPAQLQPRASVFHFEGDALDASWWTLDRQAKLAITREAANVASGQGALEFLYPARQGVFEQIGVSGLTVGNASFLSLKLKATSPTSISFGVQERSGVVYQGLLWVPADKWVPVRSRLDDLILAEDSADADGRLNPSEITSFFVADLANLPGEVGRALGWKDGEQRLWLDDLALTDDAKAPSRGRVERLGDEWLAVLDGFESDALWVLPIRQAGLKLVEGAPKARGRRGLELTYALGKGRWVGFVTAPPGWMNLSGATKLRAWIRGPLDARLVIDLEDRDGTKYEATLKVPPDDKWHEAVLPLADFLPIAAADENTKLNPGQIHRVIVLVDTFDADVKPNGTGTVAVDDLALIVPPPPSPQRE